MTTPAPPPGLNDPVSAYLRLSGEMHAVIAKYERLAAEAKENADRVNIDCGNTLYLSYLEEWRRHRAVVLVLRGILERAEAPADSHGAGSPGKD